MLARKPRKKKSRQGGLFTTRKTPISIDIFLLVFSERDATPPEQQRFSINGVATFTPIIIRKLQLEPMNHYINKGENWRLTN